MYIDKIIFRAIVYYSKSCKINATDTIRNIRSHFPFCTFSNSTFYNWYRDITSVNNIIPPKRKIIVPKREHRAEILRRLEENPTTTARAIARSLKISHSTVLDYIYNVLGYHRSTCRIIPHLLTNKLRQQRILYSKVQLAILQEAEVVQYKNIISLDESWLFYSYFPSHCYIKSEAERQTVVRRQQGERKVMLTAAVSGGGVAGEYFLPVNATMTAQQFKKTILSSLNEWWEYRWRMLSADEQNSIIRSTEKALIAAHKVIDEEEQLQLPETSRGDAYQLMFQINETTTIGAAKPMRAAAQTALHTVETLGRIEAPSTHTFQCPNNPCFIHYDNAPGHNAECTGEYLQTTNFIRIPHPPYSPDISICDFYLFGRLKNALQQQNTQTLTEIQQATHTVLSSIADDEWIRVFREWKTRLLWIIEHNGDYYYTESHPQPQKQTHPKVQLTVTPLQLIGSENKLASTPSSPVSPLTPTPATPPNSSLLSSHNPTPTTPNPFSSPFNSITPTVSHIDHMNNAFVPPTSSVTTSSAAVSTISPVSSPHVSLSTNPNPLFTPTSSPIATQTTSLSTPNPFLSPTSSPTISYPSSLSTQNSAPARINNPLSSSPSEQVSPSIDPNPFSTPISTSSTASPSSLFSQTICAPPVNNPISSPLSKPLELYSSVYVCEFCPYRTPHYGHYQQHLMRHRDDRPFKCPVDGCKYAAFQKSDLDKHMHVHESESERHQIRYRKNCIVSHPALPPFFSRKSEYALSDFVTNSQTDFSFPDFSSKKTEA